MSVPRPPPKSARNQLDGAEASTGVVVVAPGAKVGQDRMRFSFLHDMNLHTVKNTRRKRSSVGAILSSGT